MYPCAAPVIYCVSTPTATTTMNAMLRASNHKGKARPDRMNTRTTFEGTQPSSLRRNNSPTSASSPAMQLHRCMHVHVCVCVCMPILPTMSASLCLLCGGACCAWHACRAYSADLLAMPACLDAWLHACVPACPHHCIQHVPACVHGW